ncbi:MAG: RNA polymerase sigma factor [Deltaproteobacteria bacterium]
MDDLEFVQRCVEGDKKSWDEFITRYSRLIYNYIHSVIKLTGSVSFGPDSADDLFQEIILSLVKDDFHKLKSFKGKNGCTLATWLRQITVNATIDRMRKFRAAVSLDDENSEESSLKDGLADGSVSAKDNLANAEKIESLIDCIGRLDTDEQYFLELHVNRDLSLEEVKDILAISRGAADMRKSRIIDKLKDCFKFKGFALDS